VELSSFIIYIYKILDHFIQGKNIQEITSLEISDIENLIVSLENLNKTTQIEKWAKILRSRLEWKPVLENYYYLQVNFYNLSTPTRGKIKAIFYSLRNLVISSIIVGIIVKLLQNFQFIRESTLLNYAINTLALAGITFSSIEGYKEGFKKGNILLSLSCEVKDKKYRTIKISEYLIDKKQGFFVKKVCKETLLIMYYKELNKFLIKKTFVEESFKKFEEILNIES
jgi:uncharacterized protein YggT (Ycf19 family)